MSTTPNNTPDRYDNFTAPPHDPTGEPGAHPGSHWPLRIGVALAAAAIIAAGLFVAISSGLGTSTTTITTAADQGNVVTVAVTAPTSNSVIAADQVTVRGTVSPADATVQVQGQPAAVGNGVFTGTATLHGGKTTIDVIASAPDAPPASTTVVVARQSGGDSSTSTQVAAAPSGQPAPAAEGGDTGSGDTSCGGELSVGPDTTCAFAENVRAAYAGSGPGTVVAYSPVTDRTYAMSCSAGSYVVCTGGDHASVYFPSDSAGGSYQAPQADYSQSAPDDSQADTYAGESSCGAGLAVGPATSCSFAENVRSAYEGSGAGDVVAYSPVTHKTYTMSCADGSPVVCTGGDNATVYIY
ncbi:MAG TPA: hypothetical protein VL972_00350 [Solirubrobacteraceae bacterium]|nr:hypothetical protein [Solirubrobacteraceae bacterium]